MLKVLSQVKLHEVDGIEPEVGEFGAVTSHPAMEDLVVFKVRGFEFTVNKNDVLCAVQNACNANHKV